MNNKKKSLMNLLIGVLGQMISLLLGIFVPRLFLVNYGSEVNGFLNSITQIFSYFVLFEAGVGTATLQALYGPVATDDKDNVSSIIAATNIFYKKTGIFYIIAVLVIAIIYPIVVVTEMSKLTMFAVILFNGFAGAISYFFQGKYILLLKAQGKTYIQSLVSIVIQLIINASKIILLVIGCNLVLIQASYFIIHIIQMLFYYFYVRKELVWVNLKKTPNFDAINQRNSVMLHQFSGLVFSNTDIVVLTFFSGDLKIVSVYSIYNMIVHLCKAIINSIVSSVTFRLGQLYNTDKKRYYEFHNIFEIGNMIIVFSVFTVFYNLIEPFVLLYTDGVTDIDYIIPYIPLLFVLIQFLTNARESSNLLINFAGHFKQTQGRSLLETFINLIASIIGVKIWGIYGVLIGTILALVYRANDMILYTYKHIIKENPWKTYRRWLINIMLFVGIVYISKKIYIDINSYFDFFRIAVIETVIIFSIYVTGNVILERKFLLPLFKTIINNYSLRENHKKG